MVIYSIDRDRVDPVFFPVVPDSFMNRDGSGRGARRATGEWIEEVERPLVPVGDRWSF
jgi:hypothetical protein